MFEIRTIQKITSFHTEYWEGGMFPKKGGFGKNIEKSDHQNIIPRLYLSKIQGDEKNNKKKEKQPTKVFHGKLPEVDAREVNLVGDFNPFEKNISQIGNLPQGVKIKNVWNHHLVNCWRETRYLGMCKIKKPSNIVRYTTWKCANRRWFLNRIRPVQIFQISSPPTLTLNICAFMIKKNRVGFSVGHKVLETEPQPK